LKNHAGLLLLVCLTTLPARPDTLTERLARQVFELANQERRRLGVAECAWEEHLAQAARVHRQDMCVHDFFDHASPLPGKASVEDRVRAAGGPARGNAENIYWSSGLDVRRVPQSTVKEWLESPGHRENLVDPRFQAMGLGVYCKGQEVWVTQVLSE